MISVRARFSHERYGWLDQARGLVALLFIVSAITWSMSGDLIVGEAPIAPPHLDHGYHFLKAYPAMITLIDVGQGIFLFMVGLSGYIAFSSRLAKGGMRAAWVYGIRRVIVLLVISFIGELMSKSWDISRVSWNRALYEDVVSQIAMGCIATYLAVSLVRKADRRAAVGFGVFIAHAFLYGAYLFDRYPGKDLALNLPDFPFGTVNLAAIAIVGSAAGQWIVRDFDSPVEALRRRIMPLVTWSLVASYCLQWVQPSEQHDVTAAHALMSVGFSGALVAATYALDQHGLHFPGLAPLGRNLLMTFIIAAVLIGPYMNLFPTPFLREYPFATLLFVAVLPIAAIVGAIRILDRWNIAIRA